MSSPLDSRPDQQPTDAEPREASARPPTPGACASACRSAPSPRGVLRRGRRGRRSRNARRRHSLLLSRGSWRLQRGALLGRHHVTCQPLRHIAAQAARACARRVESRPRGDITVSRNMHSNPWPHLSFCPAALTCKQDTRSGNVAAFGEKPLLRRMQRPHRCTAQPRATRVCCQRPRTRSLSTCVLVPAPR